MLDQEEEEQVPEYREVVLHQPCPEPCHHVQQEEHWECSFCQRIVHLDMFDDFSSELLDILHPHHQHIQRIPSSWSRLVELSPGCDQEMTRRHGQ